MVVYAPFLQGARDNYFLIFLLLIFLVASFIFYPLFYSGGGYTAYTDLFIELFLIKGHDKAPRDIFGTAYLIAPFCGGTEKFSCIGRHRCFFYIEYADQLI